MPETRSEKNKRSLSYYHKNRVENCYNRRNRLVEIAPGDSIPYDAYYTSKNVEKHLLAQAKARSKKAGIEFNITLEDVVIPDLCPYLMTPMTCIYGKGRKQTNASIDRIDSSKGYIKGNVQVISLLANMMKTNATEEQLVAFAVGVMGRHSEAVARLF
jgi:hypothetical protein